jgi:hypothetical protein
MDEPTWRSLLLVIRERHRREGGAMPRDPEIVRGLLGWSNKRVGLEFYRWDDKIIPRHGSEWGDLLAQEPEVVGSEGCPVVVVVLPRSWSGEDVQAVERGIAEIVGAAGDTGAAPEEER